MSLQSHIEDKAATGKLLFGKNIAKGCIFLLIGFPILNYTMDMPLLHSLGAIWDKVILLILAGVALLRYLQGHRPQPFAWSRYAGWYMIYCIGLMIIGYVRNATVAFDGLSMDVEFILFGMLLPYVVDTEEIPKYLYAIVAESILLGIDGVFQYITKVPNPASWADVGEVVRTRVFSVFGSPAEFAANMEMTIPLLLALALSDKHRMRKWLYISGGLFCLCTFLFTYSRGAWMAFSLAVLLVSILFERRLLIFLVLFGLILFFLPPIHHRIMDLLSPVYFIKSAQGGRLFRWQAAFDAMAKNPLFGVGLGRYGGAIATAYHYSVYSDSYYAKILGESGIVGLILFFGIHIGIVREMTHTVIRHTQGKDRYVALAGFVGTMAIMIHSFVENLYEYSFTVVLYYLVVGLILLWGRTRNKTKTQLEDSL